MSSSIPGIQSADQGQEGGGECYGRSPLQIDHSS